MNQHYLFELNDNNEYELVGISNDPQVISEWKIKNGPNSASSCEYWEKM